MNLSLKSGFFLCLIASFVLNYASAQTPTPSPSSSRSPTDDLKLINTVKNFEQSTAKMNSSANANLNCTLSPTPSPSPSAFKEKVIVGMIIQNGLGGAPLKNEELIQWGLVPNESSKIGKFDAKKDDFFQRLTQSTANNSNTSGDAVQTFQIAADLLLKGAGSFYNPNGDVKQDSVAAADWFEKQMQTLKSKGIVSNEDQVHDLISMMMSEMYSNYNDPLNPGVAGGDNLPRNLANMGAGYQQFLEEGSTNDLGGVCDHIAAAGCQLWNKVYPDKPCFIVNIQAPGLQHWVTATENGDGTYTLMDAGSKQTMTAEGNAISAPGNPQLYVPIAKVNEAGDAIIVETPPSELMNFMKHISRPDTEEGQLFRGMSQSGVATFKMGKKPGRPLVLSIGGGRGKLSNQNLGSEVWAIYANVDKTGKFLENKLTIFYSMVGSTQVSGLENSTAAYYAISLIPNLTIDLRAGVSVGAGAIIPDQPIEYLLSDVGFTFGGKFFGQTAVKGEKQINPKTKVQGKMVFRGEGLPGLVITQMHGVDNGYGLKNGVEGFNAKFINQNQFQVVHQTTEGIHTAGLQGGVTYGPLNLEGKPDWNLGGNYSFDNLSNRGFRSIETQVGVQQYQNFFNQGTVGKLSVGSTFASTSRKSNRVTLFTPSLSAQMTNVRGKTEFFGGAGVNIRFEKKPAKKK